MAYSDTNCPCGGHKQPETMLCLDCDTHLAQRPEMRAFSDPASTWEQRRGSAIRLIALARSRRQCVNDNGHLMNFSLANDESRRAL